MTGLKKRPILPKSDRFGLVDPECSPIPISRQCSLLGVSRSGYYYEPKPISDEELTLMKKIDEIYTELPFYGSPKITRELRRQGYIVNHKRVERLMREMGLAAIFPSRSAGRPHSQHPVFPYLLTNVKAGYPNHIWAADITFIRGQAVWFYLVAILDWYSRFVLSWRLSRTLSDDFCIEALEEALKTALPDIHNSDQGSQFTSYEYIRLLKSFPEIKISMDSRGRCFDNIFTERLWRTVKYEEVYLRDYASYEEARDSLKNYFRLYNYRRFHQSLDYKTPAETYFRQQTPKITISIN